MRGVYIPLDCGVDVYAYSELENWKCELMG